ncbi:S49 family peptidase [Neorhizobium galegae]|uniref:S49 family peptidase n=1 Tax=Neorhizobium galegae TaxID=399 RepID=UPI001F41CDBE|nr:S49 family peptidase [Neorhizobium galegae]UIK04899.1 S49 family peptidase [Neorhizobium galegae]
MAIIPLRGVISNRMNLMGNISGGGGTSSEAFIQQLRNSRDDEGVKAVILDVDTPGGAVSGTDEAAGVVQSFKGIKPIIAQVNASAASAGYWMIAGADEIVVTPSGQVGSIGVYTIHDDISAALEKAGIKKTIIGAGQFKTETNPFAPLSEEALDHVRSQVTAYYDMFVERVASGRGVATSAVRDGFGKGRMVMARQAVADGMADRIGTMEETLQRFGVEPQPDRKRALAPERMKRAASL